MGYRGMCECWLEVTSSLNWLEVTGSLKGRMARDKRALLEDRRRSKMILMGTSILLEDRDINSLGGGECNICQIQH